MNGAASDAATGFGTILGISIKGRFDFGILIEKVNFHRKILDSDLSGFGIGPGVTIHLAKTNHISIAASVAYERLSFSGDIRRSNNESLHTNAVTAEVTFYHSPETSKSIRVIPAASVNFISTEFVEVSRSGGNRNRLSEFDETITLGFGLSIAVKHRFNNTVFISPEVFIT